MLLKDYIPNLNKINKKIFFSGISFDSSKVKKNFIFFAIKGSNYDGNDFIKEAIKNGAKVIVSEEKFPKEKNDVVYLKVSNVRKLLSSVAYKIIGKKPKKLVAVTGTNGKTSVTDFYYQILTTK
jgi:UDP-N-acetylmuramyl pentapeptide synthase